MQHLPPFQNPVPYSARQKVVKTSYKYLGNDTIYFATTSAKTQLHVFKNPKTPKLWKVYTEKKNALGAGESFLFLFAAENAKNASPVQKMTLWQSYYKKIIGLVCKLAMLCLPQ